MQFRALSCASARPVSVREDKGSGGLNEQVSWAVSTLGLLCVASRRLFPALFGCLSGALGAYVSQATSCVFVRSRHWVKKASSFCAKKTLTEAFVAICGNL